MLLTFHPGGLFSCCGMYTKHFFFFFFPQKSQLILDLCLIPFYLSFFVWFSCLPAQMWHFWNYVDIHWFSQSHPQTVLLPLLEGQKFLQICWSGRIELRSWSSLGPCYWGSTLRQIRAEWHWHNFIRLQVREKKKDWQLIWGNNWLDFLIIILSTFVRI